MNEAKRAEAVAQKADTARRKGEMATNLFDAAIVGDAASAVDFITNILQASTEYSTTSKSPDGAILLCNEGARCRTATSRRKWRGKRTPPSHTSPRTCRRASRAVGLFSNHLPRQRATKGAAHLSHLFKTLPKNTSVASFVVAENKYAVP